MAFSAVGGLNYLDYVQARKDRDEELMNRREEIAFQYGLGKYSKSSKESEKNVAKNSTALKVLQRDYNVSDDILAPIITSGDSTAATRLLETIDKAKEKFEADGLTMPESVVEEIFSGTVIGDQITTGEIDFEELNKFIGREMNETYKTLLEQKKVTSSYVYVPDYTYVEMPTLEELGKIPALVAQGNESKARAEAQMLKQRLAELETMNDPDSLAEKGLLSQRLSNVNSALDNFSDNPAELISLYGNSYALELMEKMPRYKEAPLPEVVKNAMFNKPLIASVDIGLAMLRAGILSEGTVVRLPTGEEIELRSRRQP